MIVRGWRVNYTVTVVDNDGTRAERRYDDYTFKWRVVLAVWVSQRQKDVSDITVQDFVKKY